MLINRSEYAIGFILVALSAVAYGLQPLFAHFAYQADIEPLGLLSVRYFLAVLFMVAYLAWMKVAWPRGRLFWGNFLIGVGYASAAIGYYQASHTTSFSLAVILMFSFPAFVALFSFWFLKERFTRIKWLSLCLALVGVVLVAGTQLTGDSRGVMWALFAAVSYGMAIVYGAHYVKQENPLASTAVVMLGALVTVIVATVISQSTLPMSASSWGIAAGLAIVCTILSAALFLAGSPKIGSSDTAMLSTLEPVVAVIIAVSLVNEALSWSTLLGGCLVLTAALLLAQNKRLEAAVTK